MLAATLIVNARMAVLKANDITDCNSTRRRIGRLVAAVTGHSPIDLPLAIQARYRARQRPELTGAGQEF